MTASPKRIYAAFCGLFLLFLGGCAGNQAIKLETNTSRIGLSNAAIVGITDHGESYKIHDRNKFTIGIFSDLKYKNHNFEAGIYFLNAEYYHTQSEPFNSSSHHQFGMLRFPLTYNYITGKRFDDSILRLRVGISAGIMVWGKGEGTSSSSDSKDVLGFMTLGPTLGASYTLGKIGKKSWLGLYLDLYRGIRTLDLAYIKYGIELRYID